MHARTCRKVCKKNTCIKVCTIYYGYWNSNSKQRELLEYIPMGLYTYIQFAYDKHKHVHVLFLLYCPLNIYWLISASVLNCLPAVTVIILQSLLYLSREHQVFSYQSAPSKRQSSELVGTEYHPCLQHTCKNHHRWMPVHRHIQKCVFIHWALYMYRSLSSTNSNIWSGLW